MPGFTRGNAHEIILSYYMNLTADAKENDFYSDIVKRRGHGEKSMERVQDESEK